MSAKISEEDRAIIGSGEPAIVARVTIKKSTVSAVVANPTTQQGVLVTGMGMFTRLEGYSRIFFAPSSKEPQVTFTRLTKKARVQYQKLLSNVRLSDKQADLFRAIFYGEIHRVS